MNNFKQYCIQNKYTNWYLKIIENAKMRILCDNAYHETHHIIPKSLGGTNIKDNLVKLTAKEHFICHLLLVKMVIGDAKRKMAYASWQMLFLLVRLIARQQLLQLPIVFVLA